MDPSEMRMNLAALQRIDPYIKTIAMSASAVALYRYKNENQHWIKTELEGTLFVYERQFEPRYGFLILNRLSTDNWVQPITTEYESQIQPPFILYKTNDSEIFGIWFYEENKCRAVGRALVRYSKLPNPKASQGKTKELSSLLTKAACAPSGAVSSKEEKRSPKEVKGGGDTKNPTSGSVMEFFAQASQVPHQPPPVRPIPISQGLHPLLLLPNQTGGHPVLVPAVRPPLPMVVPPPPPPPPPPNVPVPTMLSLYGMPNAMSLESLERKHREESVTPPATSQESSTLPGVDLESDLRRKLRISSYVKADDLEEEPQLLSPMVFTQPAAAQNGTAAAQGYVTPLTRFQLVQAFDHLLKTDSTFVGKLHQAYVESLNTKLN